MYWVNVLHIYQPPTQSEEMVHRVVKECYGPLIDRLRDAQGVKITLSIPSCLTEWFDRLGYNGIITGLAEASRRGQIEFLATAAYHPILPLIPLSEVKRQFSLNLIAHQKYFGDSFKPTGVFLPEMAYSTEVGNLVADMGFSYIVLDEITHEGHLGATFDRIYMWAQRPSLSLLFRNRRASDAIAFGQFRKAQEFIDTLVGGKGLGRPSESEGIAPTNDWEEAEDQYVVTAIDGETFGHHKGHMLDILFDAYGQIGYLNKKNEWLEHSYDVSAKYGERKSEDRKQIDESRGQKTDAIEPVLGRELLTLIEEKERCEAMASSCVSTQDDLGRGIPYRLWKHPDNEMQIHQWRLVHLVFLIMNKNNPINESTNNPINGKITNNLNAENSRDLLDKALHSDQFWWASGEKLHTGDPTSSDGGQTSLGAGEYILWSPEMIGKGADLLLNVIKETPGVTSSELAEARDVYLSLMEAVERKSKG